MYEHIDRALAANPLYLPDKPSELIYMANGVVESLDRRFYTPYYGDCHSPRIADCRVDLTGMFMAARLGVDWRELAYPDMFKGYPGNLYGKLVAIGKLQFGEYKDALCALGYDGRGLATFDDAYHYHLLIERLTEDQLEEINRWEDEMAGITNDCFTEWDEISEFLRCLNLLGRDLRHVGL